MYKRILLIVPPFYRFLGSRNNWIHLGLSYIAAVLNQHGHYVRVYNADATERAGEAPLDKIFEENKSLREALRSPKNEIWNEIRSTVKDLAPDMVGITIVFSVTRKIVEKIAEVVKNQNPNIKVVVGGPHATLAPEDTLKNPNFDFLVGGEGETPALELAQGKSLSQIKSLSWKPSEGTIVHNPQQKMIENLDELPFPNFELELIRTDPKENFIPIAATRGCPFSCVFCSSPRIWGKKIRFRSAENVIEEIKYRHDTYGVRKFYFSDDNFNINREYALSLCNAIIESDLDISWICEARVIPLDEQLVTQMKAAGCKRVKLGVESGNDRILRLMKKGITVNQVRKAANLLRKVGLPYTFYALIGMPTETREEMIDTLNLCKDLDPDWCSLSIATPQVGTELYEMMQHMGVRFPEDEDELFFHQGAKALLNENVTGDIVNEFLDLNRNKTRRYE